MLLAVVSRHRRAALAVEGPVPSPEPPPCGLQCVTHATAELHGHSKPRADPGSAGLVFPGELTAAGPRSGDPAPPPAVQLTPRRPILRGRSGSDLGPV